jgi:hypothetical protein
MGSSSLLRAEEHDRQRGGGQARLKRSSTTEYLKFAGPGLRMWMPPGWGEVRHIAPHCVNPVQRLTIAGEDGGLVQIQGRCGR